MRILVVSDREYKKTSRGIDIITTILAERKHSVDHLVFFRRLKKRENRPLTDNIHQYYFFNFLKPYVGKLQFLVPGFLLRIFFHYIIQKQTTIDYKKYDYVILESGSPLYLAFEIQNRIIYRQSDPFHISFNSNRRFYEKLELEVIKKSDFILSALRPRFYIPEYKSKYIYWHSGFIPNEKESNHIAKKSFMVLGGDLDWLLLNKMAKRYPLYEFNIVGIRKRLTFRKNIFPKGYLEYDNYQNTLASASVVIIPFSNHYVRQLRQVFFTAKILVSMQMGIPILLSAYGDINETDPEKKLFIYKTHRHALLLLDEIIKKIESGQIDRKPTENARDFLRPQIFTNTLKELETIINRYING